MNTVPIASGLELDHVQFGSAPQAEVPEPTTLAIWSALGLITLVIVRRRR